MRYRHKQRNIEEWRGRGGIERREERGEAQKHGQRHREGLTKLKALRTFVAGSM
jgi:hypothetical protein